MTKTTLVCYLSHRVTFSDYSFIINYWSFYDDKRVSLNSNILWIWEFSFTIDSTKYFKNIIQ